MVPERTDRPLIALDLLRFACAGGVVAYHLFAASIHAPSHHGRLALAGIALPSGGAVWTWWGWVGVELFFVISGAVIYRSAARATPLAFVARRALRLLPAAMLCATATTAVLLAAGIEPAARIGAEWRVSALLLPMGEPVDGSYWTLPIEVAFYLLVAATLATRNAASIEIAGRLLGLASVGLLLGAFPFDAAAAALHVPGQLVLYGAEFALGMVLAEIQADGRATALRLGWAGAMALAVLATTYAAASAQDARFGLHQGPWLPVTVVAIGLAVVALAPRLQAPLARSPLARHATTMGLMTYPLYLVHQDAGLTIAAGLARRGVPWPLAAAAAVGLALAFARMVVWIEPMLRRMLARALLPRPMKERRMIAA